MNPYTLHINLYDLAFLGAIFIGLTLVVLLWFTKRITNTAKLHRILAAFALLWLLWIPLKAADYLVYRYQLDIHAYYPLSFFLAAVIAWLAIEMLKPQKKDESSFISKPSPPAELKQKGIWLKNAVKENRYYDDPELNLS